MLSLIRKITICLLLSCCLAATNVTAQVATDSLQSVPIKESDSLFVVDSSLTTITDTAFLKPVLFQPNAKKAALYSGILPGLGHIYIRQYWKLPIIYIGAGAATYFITSNLDKYRTYRKAYIARLSGEPDGYDYLTNADLQVLQDAYKRNLDMAVLFSALGYTVQILDALASAHLKNFDISEDISMRFQPMMAPNGGIGLGVAVHFK